MTHTDQCDHCGNPAHAEITYYLTHNTEPPDWTITAQWCGNNNCYIELETHAENTAQDDPGYYIDSVEAHPL